MYIREKVEELKYAMSKLDVYSGTIFKLSSVMCKNDVYSHTILNCNLQARCLFRNNIGTAVCDVQAGCLFRNNIGTAICKLYVYLRTIFELQCVS